MHSPDEFRARMTTAIVIIALSSMAYLAYVFTKFAESLTR